MMFGDSITPRQRNKRFAGRSNVGDMIKIEQ